MKRRIDDILFNGYVREPVPMVFLATLVGIVALVFAIWSSIPSNADTHETNLIFLSYKEDGPIYVLTALNGDTYYIPQKAVEDTYVIDGLVDDQISVIVEYSSCSGEGAPYDIVSISTIAGNCVISSDVISKANAANAQNARIIMWTFCILYWVFIGGSYFILSNAPQYPRIASLLVKKAFRNF